MYYRKTISFIFSDSLAPYRMSLSEILQINRGTTPNFSRDHWGKFPESSRVGVMQMCARCWPCKHNVIDILTTNSLILVAWGLYFPTEIMCGKSRSVSERRRWLNLSSVLAQPRYTRIIILFGSNNPVETSYCIAPKRRRHICTPFGTSKTTPDDPGNFPQWSRENLGVVPRLIWRISDNDMRYGVRESKKI